MARANPKLLSAMPAQIDNHYAAISQVLSCGMTTLEQLSGVFELGE